MKHWSVYHGRNGWVLETVETPVFAVFLHWLADTRPVHWLLCNGLTRFGWSHPYQLLCWLIFQDEKRATLTVTTYITPRKALELTNNADWVQECIDEADVRNRMGSNGRYPTK